MKKEQKKVNEWVSQYKIGYFKPLEILAQITEEVGELARELNHTYGPKKKKQSEQKNEIGEEMADIIFAIICLANSLDIDLDKKFEAIVDKRYSRDKDRWERK